MIAPLLIASALAAHPYEEAFWSRDLGRLQAELERPAPHRALFRDLLAVCTCRDPGPLGEDSEDRVLREVLRLEWARRPEAIVRDLRDPAFFSRAMVLEGLGPGPTLSWPVENERWPDEADVPAALPASCDLPAAPSSLPLPSAELIDALALRSKRLASGWAYVRASTLFAQGKREEAAKLLARLDPALIDAEVRPFAVTLRGLLDPTLVSPALLTVAAPESRASLAEHGCAAALRSGTPERALTISEGAASPFLTLCRAAALAHLGRSGEAIDVLVKVETWDEARRSWARALILTTGEPRALEPAVKDLSDRDARSWLLALGQGALERGHLAVARAAQARLAAGGDGISADALGAELAFREGDLVRFSDRVTALLDEDGERFRRRAERLLRDRRTGELLRRLVLLDAQERGRHRPLLRDVNERFGFVAGRALQAEAKALEALLSEDPAAPSKVRPVGTVVLSGWPELPAPPPAELTWPQPGPLLGIPTPEGGLRTWFGGEEVGDAG